MIETFVCIGDMVYPISSLQFQITETDITVFLADHDEAIAIYIGAELVHWKQWLFDRTAQPCPWKVKE